MAVFLFFENIIIKKNRIRTIDKSVITKTDTFEGKLVIFALASK